MHVDALALRMLDARERDEQRVERVPDDEDAAAGRRRLRALARQRDLRTRTARLGDAVAVVRLDAAVRQEDAATMRATLRPKG